MVKTIGGWLNQLPRLWQFAFTGGSVFVIGLGILFLLVDLFGWEEVPANALQLSATFLLSYTINRRWTWRDRYVSHRAIVKFIVSRGVTALMSYYLFAWLVQENVHYMWANILCVGLMTMINFAVSDNWVFRDSLTTKGVFVAKHSRVQTLSELRLGWRDALQVLLIVAVFLVAVKLITGTYFVPFMLVSLAMVALAMAYMFLVSTLYAYRDPTQMEQMRLPPPKGPSKENICVFVPARHEVNVLGYTLLNAAWTQSGHLSHKFCPVVCDDDPDTIRVARIAANIVNGHITRPGMTFELLHAMLVDALSVANFCEQPLSQEELEWVAPEGPIDVLIYRLSEGTKPSKPLQLNDAFALLQQRAEDGWWNVQFTVFTILDAESVAREGLLTHVDQAFQDNPEVDIIQGGVQLMPPKFEGSWLRRLGQYFHRWYSWHNLLEYYRWFAGQMRFQSDQNFMPLGGNTVFVKVHILVKTDGWPMTLTEDCALGVLATAVYGARTMTFYMPELATQEETPGTLKGLMNQRVRWTQGFLQSLIEGLWRRLPTRRQRMLALWILSMSLFQALSAVLLPMTAATMVAVESPVILVLMMCTPLVGIVLSMCLQVIQLHDFGRAYDRKIAWHVYVLLLVTGLPYQWVLSYAAVKAVIRHFTGKTNWVLTVKDGEHMSAPQAPTIGSKA